MESLKDRIWTGVDEEAAHETNFHADGSCFGKVWNQVNLPCMELLRYGLVELIEHELYDD